MPKRRTLRRLVEPQYLLDAPVAVGCDHECFAGRVGRPLKGDHDIVMEFALLPVTQQLEITPALSNRVQKRAEREAICELGECVHLRDHSREEPGKALGVRYGDAVPQSYVCRQQCGGGSYSPCCLRNARKHLLMRLHIGFFHGTMV